MTDPQPLLSQLQNLLPADWQSALDDLAATLLQTDAPLRLTLVGSFSVGKSSLLNMLLGELLLQAAMEETTALPTFIEYGPQRLMQLLGSDGSLLPIDEPGFAAATTQAPEGAACAVLNLPLDWLKGLSIIDLPGLGSLSASHREYTVAQIQQSDAVLYLVDPRGPSQTDLETLQIISQNGKRVKVMVTRWDEVESAVARGEKAPSLTQWAAQIEAATGLKTRLASCSKNGLGQDDVLDFIARAKEDLADIRQRRFRAELKPILQNALGQNAQAQRSCEVLSEQAMQAFHAELMQRKQALSEFKAGLYNQQQHDRDSTLQQCTLTTEKIRQRLAGQLKSLGSQLTDESGWEDFGNQGGKLLRTSQADMAQSLVELSGSYGKLQLPPAQVDAFNLRLPAPESIELNDFLDIGKLTQLQHELQDRQEDFAAVEQKLASLSVADMNEEERAMRELLMQRQQIAEQPLPRIVQRISEGGSGAAVGRFLGEIADIGLMFVSPAAVGAKVATLVAKGAKMVNVAVKTAKVANTVTKTVKVAKGIQLGRKVAGIPEQAMNKLGVLEVLSLGYWGEKFGSMFGSAPQDEEIIDPQARAEQAQVLAEIDSQTQQLRRALARNEDIANERQLTGLALEQNKKEQARLQFELARSQQQAEQKHRDAQISQRQERQALLLRHAERAVSQWLRNFDQQTASMTDLMRSRIKSYWEDRVDALVGERLVEIDALTEQANAGPREKEATLTRLREEAVAIQNAIDVLH
jgi:GTP-binding protein EngB required for normal cell division